MTNLPLVSVIIVNWDGKKYLGECLASLKNQTYPEIEVILVDNGSSDGSVEFIKTNFPEVRLIKNKGNLGFAKGNNIGIMASRGKYIATLNNDTAVDKDWVKNLTAAAEKRQDIGMFASKILSYTNRNIVESAGMVIYSDGLARCRGYLKTDAPQYEKPEETIFPTACAALYRKDMMLEAGLFDEDYFAYCEDTDLGLRLRMLGSGCLYVPDARVYHHYSGTSKNNLLFKAYLSERNRLWTIIKTFPMPQLLLTPLYTAMRYLSYVYGAMLMIGPARALCRKGSRVKVLFILLRVYAFTLLNSVRIIKKRSRAMRNKKIKDGEFLAMLRRFRLGLRELALYTEEG